MDIGQPPGMTRELGRPANWNEKVHGPCESLPIADGMENGVPYVTSLWQPTPEEIEALKAGAPIMLRVVGYTHPPVAVYVGEVPPLRAER